MSGHDHHHHHNNFQAFNRAFAIALTINFAFVFIEAFYGWAANSMGLIADAIHNLSDVLGLGLAWFANWLLTRKAQQHFSYGYKRTTILAAVSNALLLVTSSIFIALGSVRKLLQPEIVHEQTMIWVALIAIAVNGGTALLFMRDRHRDLNIKAAFLHLAYDALISLAVVVTGIIILYTGWQWLDPVAGLIIVVTIFIGTWGLLRDCVTLLLDAVPQHIDMSEVRHYLCQIPGVRSVHDLHIWGLSTAECALTAHLVMPETSLSDHDYETINHDLEHQFNIHHVTLQVERGDNHDPCGQVQTCG